MRPPISIILFSVLSGLGYGMLALAGLFAFAHLLPAERWFGAASLGIALTAVTAGLLSSTLHLGHPERAFRAFSQWRSSWLSREGVMALATYVPALSLGFGWVFLERTDGVFAYAGLATSLAAAATVVSTGMIYATLKPIHQWRNRWVVPNYLALALMSGALALLAVATAFAVLVPGLLVLTLLSILVAAALKRIYWRFIDTTGGASTPESATGLSRIGRVRLLEAPHTEENYLLREMGYRVARRHRANLRRAAILAGFAAPFALLVVAIPLPPWTSVPLSTLAALSALAGVLVERWLFFAEARHTVVLYYGAERA